MSAYVRDELARLVREARSKGEAYFLLLEDNAAYEFERVERARLDAVQALKEVQSYADANGLSGAPQVSVMRSAYDADLEKLRRNIEVVQRTLKA